MRDEDVDAPVHQGQRHGEGVQLQHQVDDPAFEDDRLSRLLRSLCLLHQGDDQATEEGHLLRLHREQSVVVQGGDHATDGNRLPRLLQAERFREPHSAAECDRSHRPAR